jgi:hypothetical protein
MITMVAFLPIPITKHNIPQTQLDVQRHSSQVVLNTQLRCVLQVVTFNPNPKAEGGY